ncbi:MAG TPA: OmpA family protein [Alphaproteobacteria bacterium]|nr:OmpA family protein [Alphaproteobacteria bacterium]
MQACRVALSGIVLTVLMLCSLQASAHSTADVFAPVRDARGQPVRSLLSGQCVLTAWPGPDSQCLGMRREIALEDRTVYFEFNKSNLTPEAQAKLDSLAGILRNEQGVQSLSIVGYADRIGSQSYNQALSKKRAVSVRDYLIAQGFRKVEVAKVRWFGEDHPATKCPNNLGREDLIACLQPDRRVEVEVNYVKSVPAMRHHKKKAMAPAAPAGAMAPAPASKK